MALPQVPAAGSLPRVQTPAQAPRHFFRLWSRARKATEALEAGMRSKAPGIDCGKQRPVGCQQCGSVSEALDAESGTGAP